ncbi:MAG TPA: M28 family peptidase [Gemmatimonadales bacterium]|nr:M28 family peptidase [Gemmatimonadales bacterium]
MKRFSGITLAALLGLAAARPLPAQTFPTPDPVIRRLYGLGMDSTGLFLEAHALFDSLGPRLMGSPNTKAAQDWLVRMYTAWGIPVREEQYGTWRGWRRGYSHIDLVAPRIRTLQGTMLGYSPGTNRKDVTAEAVLLPRFADSTEFVKWLPQAAGKLVMVSAPLPTCRPQDDWDFNATTASFAKMDSQMVALQREWSGRNVRGTGYSLALGGGELAVRLEQGGAAGVISSRPKLGWRMVDFGPNKPAPGTGGFGGFSGAPNTGWGAMEVFETYTTKVPTIGLDCEDYGLVARLSQSGARPKIRMNLDGELLGERPVFNVLATIKGEQLPDEYVMLSAHFDSWDGSSGATDNGTGTLTMMEAMRILKLAYPHPRRSIMVGHWTGEEEGEVGSKAFTEDHPEVLKGLQALFNQDNGTGRIAQIGGAGLVHSPEHINGWLDRIPLEFKNALRFNGPGRPAGGGSDDFPFGCNGLPAFGLGSLGWDYGNVTWHTERDTYDKVVFDDLRYNATLTAMLAYLASEDPERIPLDRVDLAAQAAAQAAAFQHRVDSLRAISPKSADSLAATLNAFGGRGRGAGGTWPACEKAPRVTSPRLK